ncbi:unnamed protein product [Spirodela intermedia]|uniref:RING-type E3 ubiquitin transferase n=1 Tax=Spirodela intermedia TaxID=51605 RepID=A0A7I8JQX5_SPIIN|nr:unnamed protein product [Spirodela intermedia]CAA6672558.1 unnamed protein product [Spirodela intermedia]
MLKSSQTFRQLTSPADYGEAAQKHGGIPGQQTREASSGLTEKMVMKHLRWRKYAAFSAACAAKEICCICEEDYGEGDNVGMLSCGHGFHFVCVGRWLRQRNACLICGKTALLSIV